MVSQKLYLNKGKMKFDYATARAGVTTHNWIMGVSVVDINHGGWMVNYLNVADPPDGLTGKHHNLYTLTRV